MKRNKIAIIICLVCAGGLAGCSKFLERPPEGQLTKEQAFTNDSSLMAFGNAMYTYVAAGDFLGGRVQGFSEMLADQLDGSRLTGDFAEIYGRRNSIFGFQRNELYLKGYKIVNAANLIFENIDIANTNRTFLQGQSHFFRGMAHFELVRLFAQPYGYSPENSHPGIALRLNTSPSNIPRSTVAEVYRQVIADLKQADSLLPADPQDGNKFYTATKLIAEAYLAKVYLQMNDFTNAFYYADLVIKSNKFSLDENYTSRFSLGLTKEAILRIANQTGGFQPGSELNRLWRSDAANIPTLFFSTTYFNYATSDVADKRRVWYSNTGQSGYNALTKYNLDFLEVPIVHLTEIKLIRAEAAAELGGASLAIGISDINDLLTRAYGTTSRNLPAGATVLGVISTARTQRELEMTGEGNRLQEIKRIGVRNGTNIDRRNSPWNCNGLLLQFPKTEQDAN
ncbi:MAG: RagB/SusD family nutrient uptake outer membrane protein, partial [Chitinophagaceae bacterium]|nr:RagB/SusD family nutrient uptake outer membrane protein [Chitinophagaceae bacterium]